MYFMVKYHPATDPRTIKPVVKSPRPPFDYFLARSSIYDIDLVVSSGDPALVQEFFPHYSALSNISEDVYKTLIHRANRKLAATPPVPGPYLVGFLVPGEDPRPVLVDAGTPSHVKMPLERFEGVSRIQTQVRDLETVMRYWPDSFCHDVLNMIR